MFFGKKRDENGQSDNSWEPQPEKAQQWFSHARAMADTFNFEAALEYYARGIRLDPETMSAHEAIRDVAVRYRSKGGKPASSKEIKRLADDGHPVSRFAACEFAWMKDLHNPTLAVKTVEAAVQAGQFEFGNWVAPFVLNLLRAGGKKLNKSTLLQAKNLFAKVGAWDQAIEAGEQALQIDPSDNDLSNELKNLAAQRAMDQGRYEEAAGEEGGFRRFIRDADRQRELEEAEAISGGESIEQRNLERARTAYEAEPTRPEAINTYAQLLRRRDTDESRQQAYELYLKGFEDTGEYRFRMNAGDIKIEDARRRTQSAREAAEKDPSNPSLKAQYEQAREAQLALESKEFNERIEKYPTDLNMRFRLGEVEFALKQYESAMGCFQKAKEEPKLRVRASHLLGRCFAQEGWHAEAIAEFKEALESLDASDKPRELAIRYDLMVSMMEQARTDRDIDLAREALEICSGIARRDITYRDIRAQRKAIDALIKELSG